MLKIPLNSKDYRYLLSLNLDDSRLLIRSVFQILNELFPQKQVTIQSLWPIYSKFTYKYLDMATINPQIHNPQQMKKEANTTSQYCSRQERESTSMNCLLNQSKQIFHQFCNLCSYYQFMQINIKLKIDKHHKTKTWDRPQIPYFFDNPPLSKRNRFSPKSYRDDLKQLSAPRDRDFNATASSRKIITARKNSSSKPKIQPKNSTLKKNSSQKLKKTKKKSSVIDQSHLNEVQSLRGSLPGLPGKKVVQRYQQLLSEDQVMQLMNQKTVYYVGINTGAGEDDLQGRYIWRKHQQVGYRYELLEGLGRGAFGQVIRAFDHKLKENVAVKIVRAGREHMQLALNQINILMKIKEQDIQNRKNILRIKDFIVFRKHICIITQLLTINLYQLLESNHFKPLDPQNIRAFAIQILFSLTFLKQLGVVHSDIKPENVLMKQREKVGIKLIDFGTSMFLHQTHYTYIQSRFYRAPEVILGAKYSTPIDMWSFGCLVAQLSLGSPLFAGDNEQEQLSLIIKTLGSPRHEFLAHCKNASKYFNKDLSPKIIKGKDGKAILPSSKPLDSMFSDPQLCKFLSKLLRVQPQTRLTPLQALAEPWILAYFPEDMRKQHLNDVLLKIKKQESHGQKELQPSIGVRTHKKRNSQLQAGTSRTHRRRGSEGIF